jgi:hypothetical protein
VGGFFFLFYYFILRINYTSVYTIVPTVLRSRIKLSF